MPSIGTSIEGKDSAVDRDSPYPQHHSKTYHSPNASSARDHSADAGDRCTDMDSTMCRLQVLNAPHVDSNKALPHGGCDRQIDTHSAHTGAVLLCIRLPSGDRIQGTFKLTDTLETVVGFARQYCDEEEDWDLSTGDVPKRVFRNLSVSLREAGLTVRTVVYLSQTKHF